MSHLTSENHNPPHDELTGFVIFFIAAAIILGSSHQLSAREGAPLKEPVKTTVSR